MALIQISVILLASLVSVYAGTKDGGLMNTVKIVMDQNAKTKATANEDRGSFVPCLKTDPPFTLNWSPAEIKTDQTMDFNLDITPIVSISAGTIQGTVYLPNYVDPIYQGSLPFDCSIVHKIFPQYCPFKKGKRVSLTDYKFTVPASIPLPGGTYTLIARIFNSNGQLFACLNGTINVAQPEYKYDDDYNGNYDDDYGNYGNY